MAAEENNMIDLWGVDNDEGEFKISKEAFDVALSSICTDSICNTLDNEYKPDTGLIGLTSETTFRDFREYCVENFNFPKDKTMNLEVCDMVFDYTKSKVKEFLGFDLEDKIDFVDGEKGFYVQSTLRMKLFFIPLKYKDSVKTPYVVDTFYAEDGSQLDEKTLILLGALTIATFNRIEKINLGKLIEDGLTDREFLLYNMIKFRLDSNWNPTDPLSEHGSLFHFWNIGDEDRIVDEYLLGFNNGGDLESPKFQSNNSYYDCASPVLFPKPEINIEEVAGVLEIEISADVEIISHAIQYTNEIKAMVANIETQKFRFESFEEMEKAVETFIEIYLGKPFDKNNVAASPELESSMVYSFSNGDFMFQLFIDVKHNGEKVVFTDYYPASIETKFKLENTGNKTYFAKEYKVGEFGIFDKDGKLYAERFKSVEDAQRWYNKEVENNNRLAALNDAVYATLESGEAISNINSPLCIYCEENPSSHFLCDSCGVGMCDKCYDSDREHTQHYNKPLEECEDINRDTIKKVCNSEDPDYICEACMKKALSLKPQDFADEANKTLLKTPLRAVIIETSELYGEDAEEVDEGDPYFMQPMYEGYIEDENEEEIDSTRTGRYCSLKSVSEELEAFAENELANYVSSSAEELVGTRWKSKEELEQHLVNKGMIAKNLEDVDESGLVQDYAFIGGIKKYFGILDIYYLKIPYGDESIYITEVCVSNQ